MREIISKIKNLKNKEDFVCFVELLTQDLRDNPEKWENKTLVSYLEAMSSWTEDMEGYYKNTNQTMPQDINWKIFADILMAATMYE